MFVARHLGPSNYGLISYAASLVAFAAPIMKLGLDATLVYEIVNDEKNEGKIIGTSIVMCLLSSILCIIGITSFVFFVNAGETDTLIITLLYSILLLFQAIEIIQYWFQAKLLSKYSSISMLISYFVLAIVQIYILTTNKNIYIFALSYTLDYLIVVILLILIYLKKERKKLSFSKKIGLKLFNKSKYYIVSSLMITIFAQTDKIMIKLMMNNENVGFYSASVTCANMFGFVFAALIDSMRPSAFCALKESKEKFNECLTNIYSIIIYLSLFFSIGVTIFSPLIIKIMYGSSYISSISALRIIVWYTTFSYIGTIRNIYIMSKGYQKCLLLINFLGAVTNIFINFLLIPSFGINGAAFASLVTQVFTNFIIGFILKPIKENNLLLINALDIRIFLNIIKRNIKIRKISK